MRGSLWRHSGMALVVRSSYAGLTRVSIVRTSGQPILYVKRGWIAGSKPGNDDGPNSRRSRLLAQFAIVDVANHDRPSGDRTAQSVREFQRLAPVERGVDRLQICGAGIRR